jgi:putative hydroxymethylpyrimidine transport system ATP-binding protein
LFDGLDLELPAGSITCLLGTSGIGKSSLLRLIAGLLVENGAADLRVSDGQPIAGRVAYMDQRDLLLPWLNVAQNVALGARLRGEAVDTGAVRAILDRVGLPGQENARPDTLSGGMRQRVALARTLMEDRPVVLMDEPFSSVDAITRYRLQGQAVELLSDCTVLLVTHDPMEALRIGDRVHVLSGDPARLDSPLVLPGTPPRTIGAPDIAELHEALLERLAGPAVEAA